MMRAVAHKGLVIAVFLALATLVCTGLLAAYAGVIHLVGPPPSSDWWVVFVVGYILPICSYQLLATYVIYRRVQAFSRLPMWMVKFVLAPAPVVGIGLGLFLSDSLVRLERVLLGAVLLYTCTVSASLLAMPFISMWKAFFPGASE